ncbi:hypothetical protein [Singulisphaera acidiphila]|uniref:Ribbon-helix-helix protein, copG family n=1 Tax=Singulisphaera acidiphila (strain ATCC BAA-1392 / DSM 18658 / VKM B-2454 / MOB10) TaxID=886293 RepID=L0DD65_SINAD|nr:hypothetical protein [Singulisphaera acidiphila]AGA27192.1 hypothetical protein Sinac_2905 [Singulisphaera acidiphila DSM 18658]
MGFPHEASLASGIAISGQATARIERNLGMTPEAGRFLADLASRSGHSEGDVIRLALGMFRTALDAKETGKHFGVASSPESLDIELVGF